MKSVVVDPSAYDWEGDAPLRRPSARTIIYEMHVRGFTRHPSSGVDEKTRGTFAGLIEKIPYLQELGITAVELLPVFQFDAQDCPPGKVNYWGYAPVSFFAPHQAYSSRQDPLGPVDEFRDMVKALHRAGIEVILDVVFNHTAEGDHGGPTLCFRGSTTPRTTSSRGPLALRGLHRHRQHAQRQPSGRAPDDHRQPPLLGGSDACGRLPLRSGVGPCARRVGPVRCRTRRSCGTSSRIRRSPARSSSPKRGMRRDSTRSAASSATAGRNGTDVSATTSAASSVASRVRWRGSPTGWSGSPGIYGHEEREAEQSVNFVTCHDGFTLNDLVSYDRKHNEANGEDNRDGATTTIAGTAARKGRRMIPASRG